MRQGLVSPGETWRVASQDAGDPTQHGRGVGGAAAAKAPSGQGYRGHFWRSWAEALGGGLCATVDEQR